MATKILWIKQIKLGDRFSNAKDAKLAEELLEDYLTNYEINTFNDAQKTADLCYKILLKIRTQEAIAKIISDETNRLVPDKQLTCLHDLEKDIVELEKVLGISVTKEQDELNALESLQKKFALYVNFHRNEYSLEVPFVCKKCGHEDVQMHLIRRRCDKENFEVLRHPFFSGRFLFNFEILNDCRDGKITKEQAARYLRTSTSYVEWAELNRYKIIDIDGFAKEEVDEFINKNSFLPSSEELTEK